MADSSACTPRKKFVNGIHDTIQKHKQDIAFIEDNGRHITFEQFGRLCDNVEQKLANIGLESGDVITLLMQRSLEVVVSSVAAVRLGASFLMIEPDLPLARIQYMIQKSNTRVLLTQENFQIDLQVEGTSIIEYNKLTRNFKYDRLPKRQMGDNDKMKEIPLYIIFTSGSTGVPKGVLASAEATWNRLQWMWDKFPWGQRECLAFKTSLAFVDSIWEMFGGLLKGVTTVIVPKDITVDPHKFLRELFSQNVSRVTVVPSLLKYMLRYAQEKKQEFLLSKLRIVISSGEELSPKVASNFKSLVPSCTLLNLYGTSELAGDVSYHVVQSSDLTDSSIPIGAPISNVSFHLKPFNDEGLYELCVTGSCLSLGYFNAKEEHLTVIDDTVYFQTGDLVKYGKEGETMFLGRKDSQVKIRGNRINLLEIEHHIMTLSCINEAVVFQDEKNTEPILKAAVTLNEPVVAEKNEPDEIKNILHDKLSKKLPRYMLPNEIYHLRNFPTTSSGKVDTEHVRRMCNHNKSSKSQNTICKINKLSETIKEIWHNILSCTEENEGSSFYELGGHSLLAVELSYEFQKNLGITVSPLFIQKGITLELLIDLANTETEKVFPESFLTEDIDMGSVTCQEHGILTHQMCYPESQAYTIMNLYETKTVNPQMIQETIYKLLREHSVLRSTYQVAKNGTFERCILPLGEASDELLVGGQNVFQCIRIKNHTAAKQHVKDIKLWPFEGTPLLQFRIFLGLNTSYIGIVIHHAVADGMSIGSILNKLLGFDVSKVDIDSKISKVTPDIESYSLSTTCISENDFKKIEYWKHFLLEAEAVTLQMASQNSKKEQRDLSVEVASADVSKATLEVIRQLSVEERVSPFIILLSSFSIMMHFYSNRDDITFGVANSNRKPSERYKIGCFADTVLTRSLLYGNPSFRGFVQKVNRKWIEALSQMVSFTKLCNTGTDTESYNLAELCNILFVFQNASDYETPKCVQRLNLYSAHGKCDLEFHCFKNAKTGGYGLDVVYKKSLYPSNYIQQFLQNWVIFLENVTSQIDDGVFSVNLLDKTQYGEIVSQWNDTDKAQPLDKSVDQLIYDQVQTTPNSVAIEHNDKTISYHELFRKAVAVSKFVKAHSSKGGCVALCMGRSISLVCSCISVLVAGRNYVYIDPDFPDERKNFILKDTESLLMLTDGQPIHQSSRNITILSLASILSEMSDNSVPKTYRSANNPDDKAYTLYTSGSTGIPKGVCVPHRCIVTRVKDAGYFSIKETSRVGQFSSFSFDMSVFDMYVSLCNGATLVIIDKSAILQPEQYADTILKLQLSMLSVPTAIFQLMVDLVPSEFFQKLDSLFIAGEKPNLTKVQSVLTRGGPTVFKTLYGPTEVTIYALSYTFNKCVGLYDSRNILGKPVANTTAHVVNKCLNPLPYCVPGEIVIGGAGVTQGYQNLDAKTSDKFVKDHFGARDTYPVLYKTGDIGYRDFNGDIIFLHRIDNQVKVRGHRVELGEIEEVACQHQDVADAVAIVEKDTFGENHILLFILFKGSSRENADAKLSNYLSDRLPQYELPSSITVLESIPLNSVGKVDRSVLIEKSSSKKLVSNENQRSLVNSSEVQQILDTCFGSRVDLNRGFIENGGNSTLAVYTSLAFQQKLDKHISPLDILESKNILLLTSVPESKARLPENVSVKKETTNHMPQNPEANTNSLCNNGGLKEEKALKANFCTLTPIQKQFWLLHQMKPKSPRYNIPTALYLQGMVNEGLLAKAVQIVSAKWKFLQRLEDDPKNNNIVFVPRDDIPLEDYFRKKIIEDSDGKETVCEGSLKTVAEDAHFIFDLESGPLVNVTLYELKSNSECSSSRFILLTVMHHIVADAEVTYKFHDDLWQVYQSLISSNEVRNNTHLDDLKAKELDIPDGSAQQLLGEWATYLKSMEPIQFLQSCKQDIPEDEGKTVTQTISGSKFKTMADVCVSHGMTKTSFCLALLKVLVCKICRQEDITITVPMRVQNHDAFGPSIEIAPIRTKMGEADENFLTLVKDVQKNLIGAMQRLPVSLSDIQTVLRQSGKNVNSQEDFLSIVTFNFIQTSSVACCPARGSGIVGEFLSLEKYLRWAKSPLCFDIAEFSDTESLNITVTYQTCIFEEDYVTRMLSSYLSMIDTVSKNVSVAWKTIPLAPEEPHVYDDIKQRTDDDKFENSLPEAFLQTIRTFPECVAVKYESKTATYKELESKARSLASSLNLKNPRDITGIYMERSLNLAYALMACVLNSCTFVYSNPKSSLDKILHVLKDSKCTVVLCDTKSISDLQKAALQNIKIVDVTYCEELTEGTEITRIWNPVFSIMYTSGSTGMSKGVVLEQKSVHNKLSAMNKEFQFKPGTKVAQVSSFTFDVVLPEFYFTLLYGGCVIMVPENISMDPPQMKQYLHDENIKVCYLPTAIFNFWVSQDSTIFQNLDMVVFGGEKANPYLVQAIRTKEPKRGLLNCYGLTETCCMSTLHRVDYREDGYEIPIGTPMEDTMVKIVDRFNRPLPRGYVGELLIGGSGIFSHYLCDTDKTSRAQLICPETKRRFVRTGDLVKLDNRNQLVFVGREDATRKYMGKRVNLEEINYVVASHPKILECFAILEENSYGIIAFYTTEDLHDCCHDLQVFCSSHLPTHMVPSVYKLIQEFPRTLNGKIDSKALQFLLNSQALVTSTDIKSDSSVIKRLKSIWSRILNNSCFDGFEKEITFFRAGGNSFKLYSLKKCIEDEFDIAINMSDMFVFTTITKQAELVEKSRQGPSFEGNCEQIDSMLQKEKFKSKTSEIAVVGMACRFVNCATVEEFWKKLQLSESCYAMDGTQKISAFNGKTFVSVNNSFSDTEGFDYNFFKMSFKESAFTDPQHRWLLMTSYHALEDAGENPADTQHTIGIYASTGQNTYARLHNLHNIEDDEAQLFSIETHNMPDSAPSLVAYKLNLTGPAVAVQNACCSSLTTVHMACQALRDGDCDIALAAAAHIQYPQQKGYVHQEGMITSPTGKCRPYDESADGTVGTDGSAVVILMPLEKARRSNKRIYSVICGSAVNNDGSHKMSYSSSNIDQQSLVIKRALTKAGIQPNEAPLFIEGHGSGVSLADIIELKALKNVYGQQKSQQKIPIGSVKSVIGHTGPVSGLAGLIKSSLSLYHRKLHGSSYFTSFPAGEGIEKVFEVNRSAINISKTYNCYAALHGFGQGGTNAHVILTPEERKRLVPTESSQVIPVSGPNKGTLHQLIEQVKTRNITKENVLSVAYSANCRQQFPYRAVAIWEPNDNHVSVKIPDDIRKYDKVVLLFAGQSGGYSGMCEKLISLMPQVTQHFEQCVKRLKQYHDIEISHILYSQVDTQTEIQYAPICIFVIQYGLFQILLDVGCKIDCVIGHSIGDITAACVSGCISLEDTLDFLVDRWRAFRMEKNKGRSAAVNLDGEATSKLIKSTRLEVSIACYNSPEQTVVSGGAETIEKFIQTAQSQNIKAKLLATNNAFHCSRLEPIANLLKSSESNIHRCVPTLKMISTATGQLVPTTGVGKEYFINHILNSVKFTSALSQVYDRSTLFVDVGPGTVMQTLLKQNFKDASVESLLEYSNPAASFLSGLGSLWSRGMCINWASLYKKKQVQITSYPQYPFELNICNATEYAEGTSPRYDMLSAENKTRSVLSSVQQLISDIECNQHKKFRITVGLVTKTSTNIMSNRNAENVGSKYGPGRSDVFPVGCISNLFLHYVHHYLEMKGKINMEAKLHHILPLTNINQITLNHLARNTSGIPPFPSNINMDSILEVSKYTPENLISALEDTSLWYKPGTYCNASNFGLSVLGHCLEVITNESYGSLLGDVLIQLGMNHTSTDWSMSLLNHSAGEFDVDGQRLPPFECGAFTPADGVLSTTEDMCLFMKHLLNIEHDQGTAVKGIDIHRESCTEVFKHMIKSNDEPVYWYSGITAGSTSWIGMNAEKQTGAVILCNTGMEESMSLVTLGEKCLNLLTGNDCKEEGTLLTKDVLKLWTGHILHSPVLYHHTFEQGKHLPPVPKVRPSSCNETSESKEDPQSITEEYYKAPRYLKEATQSKPKFEINTNENIIMDTLATCLGLSSAHINVDHEAPFSHFGLDSLQAITFASKLSARIGCKLRVNDIVRFNSVSKLAGKLVNCREISEGTKTSNYKLEFPVQVKPENKCNSMNDLQSFIKQSYEKLQQNLLSHGALLFRGWEIHDAEEFAEVVSVLSSKRNLRDNYKDGISPRTYVTKNVFTSTEYPRQYNMALHNEMSYCKDPPTHLYFFCQTAPGAGCGGETPIADSREIYKHIPSNIRKDFEKKGLRYISNLTFKGQGIGKCWQETYGTNDRLEVESFLSEQGIEWKWNEDGSLHTERVFPATRRHPVTDRQAWFNHAHLFHPSDLPKDSYDALCHVMNREDLPKYVTYADGEEIEVEHLNHIRSVLEDHKVCFSWQKGDILMVDNFAVAHGRQAFTGNRRILVAMT